MAIQKATILEFQRVVKKVYGRKITSDEASEILRGLTGYFGLLAKIKRRMMDEESNSTRRLMRDRVPPWITCGSYLQ